MTTYTDILDAEIDQDSPVTDTLWTKNRDNPIAIAEGSDDAPVVAAGWHPYDQVEMGEGTAGSRGLIYDYSVDGSTGNVEAGTFDNGYEYKMVLDSITHNAGSDANIIVELYLNVDAAWSGNITFTGSPVATTARVCGEIIACQPNLPSTCHYVKMDLASGTAAALAGDTDMGGVYDSTPQRVTNMRFGFLGATINGGKVYLFRRRMDA
jgi:hypothetical protein